MKTRRLKIGFSLLFFVVVILLAPIYTKAAGDGTSMQTAIGVSFNKYYEKTWNSGNYGTIYNKIDVQKDGCVSIVTSYPEADSSRYGKGGFDYCLYDKTGKLIWNAKSGYNYAFQKGFGDLYVVGLRTGTYYLAFKPNSSVISGKVKLSYYVSYDETVYRFNHTINEVEPDNSEGQATLMAMGDYYQGYLGPEGGMDTADYYSVYLQNDHCYYLAIGVNNPFGESINQVPKVKLFSSKGVDFITESTLDKSSIFDNTYDCYFIAPSSGMYYIEVDCIDQNQHGYFIGISDDSEASGEITPSNNIANGLHRNSEGKWYLYQNGLINTTYCGLYNDSSLGWCYLVNGKIDFGYTGLTLYNGKWYYVQNGMLKWGVNTLVQYNGTWYYVNNSTVDWNYTGLTNYGGTWYYIQKGVLKWGVNTLVLHNGTWYYVNNSAINWNYTGLVNYNGSWYYVQKGVLKWGVNTLVYYNGTWYYVKNSTLDWNYTGMVSYNGDTYYVQKGQIKWGVNGLTNVGGTWYYLSNSAIKKSYTGLVQYNGNWYYVQNGMLKWGVNTLVYYNGSWYYVSNSTLDWNYTGMVPYNGDTYYVQKGQIKWGVNGLTNVGGTWYYLSNSAVKKSYTGLVENNNVLYYVQNGVLDWNFSGIVKYCGVDYIVEKGVATGVKENAVTSQFNAYNSYAAVDDIIDNEAILEEDGQDEKDDLIIDVTDCDNLNIIDEEDLSDDPTETELVEEVIEEDTEEDTEEDFEEIEDIKEDDEINIIDEHNEEEKDDKIDVADENDEPNEPKAIELKSENEEEVLIPENDNEE